MKTLKSTKYTILYKTDNNSITYAAKCIPKKGFLLYKVGGTYSKTRPLTFNWFLAKSKQDAKKQYKNLYGWNATECQLVVSKRETEKVLANMYKMPM